MRKLIALAAIPALVAMSLPTSAFAADMHRHHDRYTQAERAYAAEPVYAAAWGPTDPLLFPVGGAIIGAVIGAAVCPPCAIAGSALTSGGGALVGAGIGAISGTVVGLAVAQPRYARY